MGTKVVSVLFYTLSFFIQTMAEWFPGQEVPLVKSEARDRISRALAYVLGTKEYGRVTVVDLVNASGVSRSTFYRCFQSIDDVVIYQYSRMIEEVLNRGLPTVGPPEQRVEEFSSIIANVAWKYREVLSVFNMCGLTPRIIDAGKKMVKDAGMSDERAFGAMYQVAGVAGWLVVWLDDGVHGTEEDLRKRLVTLLTYGHTSPNLLKRGYQ